MRDIIEKLQARVQELEAKLAGVGDNIQEKIMEVVKRVTSQMYVGDATDNRLDGLQLGVVVATDDPLKMGRIRFWHPMMGNEVDQAEGDDWAYPISAFGGFDDCGATWVPPAGSTVCLLFHNGNKQNAYYIGTTWTRDRGNPPAFPVPVPEYNSFWLGTRGGYLDGQDESQVQMPWNNEIYNGKNLTDTSNYYQSDEFRFETIPTGYGMKTPEKSMLKFYDGNRKCNLKWKRVELMSSRGNIILLKDDHLHPAGQWCKGDGGSSCGSWVTGERPKFTTEELPECCVCGSPSCPGGPACPNDSAGGKRFANPWFKRMEEQRPYRGPATPLNPQVNLAQSGIWVQSIGGHRWVADDSVDGPTGSPSWDREFGFGCNDRCLGSTFWGSMTGHGIRMSDVEDQSLNRGPDNGIFMSTAGGIGFELNDHTVGGRFRGERRGAKLTTSCNHLFAMLDMDGENASPPRRDGGTPEANAKSAQVILASGYGTMLMFKDDNSQQETKTQTMILRNPCKENERRSHELIMQQKNNTDDGAVVMRSGGVYVEATRASNIEVVGDEDIEGEAHKVVKVKDHHLHVAERVYFNQNDITFFKAKQYIFLGAGEDCDNDSGQQGAEAAANVPSTAGIFGTNPPSDLPRTEKGPCFYPVILAKQGWMCPITQFIHFGLGWGKNALSNRVFASSGGDDAKQPSES